MSSDWEHCTRQYLQKDDTEVTQSKRYIDMYLPRSVNQEASRVFRFYGSRNFIPPVLLARLQFKKMFREI